ncbi:hypothetical protein [Colwellia sp. E150_009]
MADILTTPYQEGSLVDEVKGLLQDVNLKINRDEIKVSAKKRTGFIYIGDVLQEIVIPPQVIEWLNMFCVEDVELPSSNAILQLSEALANSGIAVPQQIYSYGLNIEDLSFRVKKKYLKNGLEIIAKQKEVLPEHLVYWVDSLLDTLTKSKRNEYEEDIKLFRKLPEKALLKDFIKRSGGLTNSVERMKHFMRYQSTLPIENEDLLFIKDMDVSLIFVKSFIERKHAERNAKRALDICALCWRPVRHKQNEILLTINTRRDSSYYCSVHHPKKITHFYKRTRDALIAAVRDERLEFSSQLASFLNGEFSRDSNANYLTKWLKSFAPKSKFVRVHNIDQNSWGKLCEDIYAEAENIYPQAFEKIKEVKPESYASYKDWVWDVLVSLQGPIDKEEKHYWETIGIDKWTLLDEGWKVLLHTFRRYEANHYVMHRKRPRGPKKSGSRPTQLKLKIEEDIKVHLKKFGNVKTGLIVEKHKTSRKTVAQVKKALGLN